MSDYDSNYNSLCCPFCDEKIGINENDNYWVNNIEDEEEDFFQCQICGKCFKAELNICKEYNYNINKPTDEEIKKYNLIDKKEEKDIIEDCPGQKFIWENLFSNES